AMTVSGGVTSINGLRMADATHGLAVGSGGTALRTTDGTSWTPVSTGISSSLTLYSVDTMDPAANGWASGELAVSSGHSKGTIMKFNGSSWSQWDTGNTSGISWLPSIDMVNSTIGFVTGEYGKVYKTTDGGGSWNAQTTGTTKHLNSVSFLNRNIGFAVGEEGRVISTTNGGTTWTTGSLGTNLRMYGVNPVANLTGVTAYTVGMSAAILKSEVVSATPPTPYHAWYDYGSSTVGLNLFDAATGYAPTQVWYSGAGNWNWSLSKTTIADQNDDDLTELDVFYDYGGTTAGLYVLDPAATYPSSGYQPQRKWLSCPG
ncbi:MAG: YCF48-related protein, partial [Actinomycetota bacterium]